jgi:hypothetical protein
MKKIALAFVIAAVAASPAMAKKMKRIHHRAGMEVASANPNENSWRLVRDAFPIVLPGAVIPIYLAAKNQH